MDRHRAGRVMCALTLLSATVLTATAGSAAAVNPTSTVVAGVLVPTNVNQWLTSSGSIADAAADAAGNVYFADATQNRIIKMAPDGALTTLAGTGATGHNDGAGNTATFQALFGIAVDDAGEVFVADDVWVRKIDTNGNVTTVAGHGDAPIATGEGDNGPATAAPLGAPGDNNVIDVAVDPSGTTLYISDTNPWPSSSTTRIRKVENGTITTFAGADAQPSPWACTTGPTAAASVFFAAADLAVDASGNLIANVQCGYDLGSNTNIFDVIQFSQDGSTATSLATSLSDVKHLTVSGSTVYFVDPLGLRSLSGGTLSTISTDPATCSSDTGTALAQACVGLPTALPGGDLLFVSKDGISTSPAGGTITFRSAHSSGPKDGDVAATTPLPDMTTSMAVDGDGSLYFAPVGRDVVRSVTTGGTFGTVAGNGHGSDATTLTDGPATSVQLGQVFSMTHVGAKSVLLVTGTQVGSLTVDGTITRLAGDGTAGNVSSVDPLFTHLRPRAAAMVGTDTYIAVAHTAAGNPCGAPTSGVCTDSKAIVKISGSPAVLSTAYTVTTGGQQQAFEDMASTPDGKLVLSTTGVPALLRFDPATATSTTVPVPAAVAGGQLAVDTSGSVFVLGPTELVKVTPANVVSVVDTKGGTDLGIDDAGNVYVSRFDTSVVPSANVIVQYAGVAVPSSWTPPVLPTLSTLVPSASRVGGTVTAVGTNLSGLTWVKVGGVPVTSFTPGATSVRFKVPAGSSGNVTAGSASGTAATTPWLTVLATPTQVSAGANHSCARLADGKVACWGANGAGQLGTGTKVNSAFPLPVSGLTGATMVAAGGTSSCAVAGGGVKCWGANAAGQLGRGSLVASLTPVAVLDNATGKAITGATSVSTGNAFACAVISGGTVKCWGQNTSGQLGDGTKVTRTRAVTVLASAGVPLKGVTAVAAGGNTACARLSTGAVRCWGSNSNGQLGRGNVVSSSVPVAVVGLDGVAAKATVVTVGSAHACAVVAGGAVRCWGANSSGQLGDGTTTQRLSPVAVKVSAAAALSGATTVTAGAAHSCAIVGPIASATVRCWGSGANGRLGSGLTSSSVARLVSGTVATKAIAVAAGGAHSVVIGPNPAFAGNGISGWGLNSSGQVGDGTASSRSVPTRSPTL